MRETNLSDPLRISTAMALHLCDSRNVEVLVTLGMEARSVLETTRNEQDAIMALNALHSLEDPSDVPLLREILSRFPSGEVYAIAKIMEELYTSER